MWPTFLRSELEKSSKIFAWAHIIISAVGILYSIRQMFTDDFVYEVEYLLLNILFLNTLAVSINVLKSLKKKKSILLIQWLIIGILPSTVLFLATLKAILCDKLKPSAVKMTVVTLYFVFQLISWLTFFLLYKTMRKSKHDDLPLMTNTDTSDTSISWKPNTPQRTTEIYSIEDNFAQIELLPGSEI